MWPIARSTPDHRHGTAPDEHPDMRLKSAYQRMITDVSRLRPHLCTIITTIASNTDRGGGRRAALPALDTGHQSKNRLPMSQMGVRRGRRRFPVGVSPTRQPLQPEATGAVMEVTKWLKPSVSVSRLGDSASVQAVTRVNAVQASKRTMRRPTRQPFRGRLIRLGE
jgi:hypothetical protein